MADKGWKAAERRMARDVGSERIPVTGWRLYDKLPLAADMYAAGASVAHICDFYGVSKKVVHRALKKAGVVLRSREVTAERIEARIDKSGECWLWTGACDWKGYPLACMNATHVRVHRWMYERVKGAIPPGHHLDHLCRTPRCVNPAHLEPVTPAANTQRGAKAKMTVAQVLEMRAAYAAGGVSQRELASRYGIHEETVRGILNRRAWTNV